MVEETEHYRQFIDVSPVAMLVIDETNTIVFANISAGHVFGTQALDQLVGRVATELVHPDFREEISKRRDKVRRGVRPPISEYAALRFDGKRLKLDGSEFFSESRGIRIDWDGKPCILLIIQDISEQHLALEALRHSEEKFRNLVEGSRQGIVIGSVDTLGVFHETPCSLTRFPSK